MFKYSCTALNSARFLTLPKRLYSVKSVSTSYLYPNSRENAPFETPPIQQYVNKGTFTGYIPIANSRVEIRFNIEESTWLSDDLKQKLIVTEAHRINKAGEFFIYSEKTRKQLINQADCLERLRNIVRSLSVKPKEPSIETKEKHNSNKLRSNEKRISSKKYASFTKAYRQKP